MRACVVGNGQSPLGHGDMIDCHDLVMRMNCWWRTHPPPVAGRKITHWGWNSALYLVGLKEKREKNKVCHDMPKGKFIICVEAWRGGRKHITNAKIASAKLGRLKIAHMNKNYDSRLTKKLSRLAKRRVVPSTGIRALSRVVAMKPEHLTIIGFDATLPKRPGWNDRGNPWRKNWSCHDYVAEKRLMIQLVDGKRWVDGPIEFTIEWYGRPEEV